MSRLVQAFSLYCAYMMESSKEANFILKLILFEGILYNHRTLILWRTEGANSRIKRANPRSESANSKEANPRSEGTNARSM